MVQNFNRAILAVTMASYLATDMVKPTMWSLMAVVGPALLLPALLGRKVYGGISLIAELSSSLSHVA